MITNDEMIFHAEGTLPDGRAYRAELWQLGPAYHMTIFIPRLDAETAGELAAAVEEALIEFCGTQYRRVEPIFREGQPFWSYNVVACDDEEQFVSQLPLLRGVETFKIWYGEHSVVFAQPPG